MGLEVVDIENAKRALRARQRERRSVCTPEAARRAGEEATRVLACHLDGIARVPRCALLYAALPGELETEALDRLLRSRSIEVAYPRVAAARTLELHLAAPEDLRPGRFAIREPAAGSRLVPLSDLDWILIPGLAFDRVGHRLGFGGGYYDALLGHAPQAVRFGVCLADEILPAVPSGPGDEPVDFLLSDALVPTGARGTLP